MSSSKDATIARVRGLFPSIAADPVTKWRYDESPYFGDYAVTATYRKVEVRLIHERGSDSVEMRPVGREEWFDLALLRAVLSGGGATSGATVEELGLFFQERTEDVLAALDPRQWDLTEARLKSLEEESAKRRFGPHREKE